MPISPNLEYFMKHVMLLLHYKKVEKIEVLRFSSHIPLGHVTNLWLYKSFFGDLLVLLTKQCQGLSNIFCYDNNDNTLKLKSYSYTHAYKKTKF